MRTLKLAPLVNDGIIKVKMPFLSKGSDSLKILSGSIELNLILTSLKSRALYNTVKKTLKMIKVPTPRYIVVWQFNSIIGSLEKSSRERHTP